jgi:hypothetical protein
MNKKYLTYLACGAIALLASCRQTTTEKNSNDQDTTTETKRPKQNIIRQHIAIPGTFTHITNLGSVDIIYTQGDYNIDVEGDSAMLRYLSTTFESNLFTTTIFTDNNPDINLYGNKSNVKMYVSCPDLQCVSICGNGGFTSQGTWKTDEAQIGVFGTGTLKLEDVQCNIFKLESGDKGPIQISHLQAEDVSLYARSSANIKANLDVTRLSVYNVGTGTLHLTGHAQLTAIQHPDDPKLKNELTR